MSTDVVVVHSPVGGGHKSAALAIAEAAEARGLTVKVLDAFAYAPKVVGEMYVRAHLTGQAAFPEFYGNAYLAANRRGGKSEVLRRGFDHLAFGALVNEVRDLAPRMVIGTHHLPLVVLGRARRRGILSAPLVGVVTDYTAHAHWAEKGVDGFCVACPLAYDELLAHGVKRERIAMTGIPIRAAFSRANGVRDPLPGEPLRVLLTNGGFGVGPIRAILRSFAGVADIELTVVCGNAPAAVTRVTRYAERFGLRAKVIGFERDMASRVADAHLVVGKAGGLTVTETLAAGRPMVVVGAVPGNEKLNEAFVVEGRAGYASKPSDVSAVVERMRFNREIKALGARARSLVVPDSAPRVVEIAERTAERFRDDLLAGRFAVPEIGEHLREAV